MRALDVNQVNILLMLLSCGVAFVLPFELVLFSYAFLGPAHYLTQISWLHDRAYFTGTRWLWPPFCILLVALLVFIDWDVNVMDVNYLLFTAALSISFAFAIAQPWKFRLFISALTFVFFLALQGIFPSFVLGLAILLPTVVHIYVFTGTFILLGALKSNSRWGYLSFLIFLTCGLVFLFITPPEIMISPSFIANNIGPFQMVADYLADLLSFGGWIDGRAMLGFLSFAYTYHYLNWFSKTKIIKWHQIPRGRWAAIVFLYLVSIGIYLYDYATGFLVLLFLSILHVVLEFPLNVIAFRQIGGHIATRLARVSKMKTS